MDWYKKMRLKESLQKAKCTREKLLPKILGWYQGDNEGKNQIPTFLKQLQRSCVKRRNQNS